jgi:hypothetical protein
MATTPDAIQTLANAETAVLKSVSDALTTLASGVLALDVIIQNFQNSPGTLSPADQAALDSISSASSALAAQATAINTTPPGTAIPPVPAAQKLAGK